MTDEMPAGQLREFYAADDSTRLPLFVFEPRQTPVAALLLFHGGAWTMGSPAMFFPHARALAREGLLVASAGYRLLGKGALSPLDCVADASRADAAFRSIVLESGLDSISIGGGSAGAQLALALSAPPEPTTVATEYDNLVLFNPALDSCCDSEIGRRLLTSLGMSEEQQRACSPLHHVRSDMPRSIILHGRADTVVPIDVARRFRDLMIEAGNDCSLAEFEGVGHGFFNYDEATGPNSDQYRCLEVVANFVTAGRPTL